MLPELTQTKAWLGGGGGSVLGVNIASDVLHALEYYYGPLPDAIDNLIIAGVTALTAYLSTYWVPNSIVQTSK